MSALTALLEIAEPLAEPLAEAVVDLVRDALAGKSVAAHAERIATLNAFKIGVTAVAEAKRAELAK